MYRILDRIDDTAAQFAAHPFFERLLDGPPEQAVQAAAEQLSFWNGAYLDLLRLSEQRVQTPALRRLVLRRLAHVDASPWLLADLRQKARHSSPFAPQQEAVRDASYALVAEALFAQTDTERIALHLALDAHARVLQQAVHLYLGFAPAAPPRPPRSIDAADAVLADLAPRHDAEVRARTLVSRTHRALAAMFDGLLEGLEQEIQRVMGTTSAA
jgi:hypothetical protein